jgi:hypothetical protein
VGPAGTGKTFGVLDVLHVLCRDNPNLRVLIARGTRASLTESVLVTYEQEILPIDGMDHIAAGVQRRVRQAYRYPSGSEIVVGGLDNPTRVLSTTWDIVFINEAIEATEEAWETLLSRMNRPGRTSRLGYLIGDTNPGDPSHWLKRRVDAGQLEAWDTPHQANPAMHDGRVWTDAGNAYLDALSSLTGTRRKRLLQGLWAAGEGAWFAGFDPDTHVTAEAEYDPRHPARLAMDHNGLHRAAVWWQEREINGTTHINVFGDWYEERSEVDAYACALSILDRSKQLCQGRLHRVVADPAGSQRVGLNTTVQAEYDRAGLRATPWPVYPGSVVTGLNLIEAFLPNLRVHPRCSTLIAALANYRRAKRNGQWVDVPEDPQHPHEDMVDALRGGLMDRWPEGRKPAPKLTRRHAGGVF